MTTTHTRNGIFDGIPVVHAALPPCASLPVCRSSAGRAVATRILDGALKLGKRRCRASGTMMVG